jgi:hypothetical protein
MSSTHAPPGCGTNSRMLFAAPGVCAARAAPAPPPGGGVAGDFGDIIGGGGGGGDRGGGGGGGGGFLTHSYLVTPNPISRTRSRCIRSSIEIKALSTPPSASSRCWPDDTSNA